MTRHYPIEITLTRPASCGDCTVPASVWRSPTTADRTRLMTIQSEKSPGSALHRMRRRIGGQLPVDSWPPPSRTRSGHLLVNAALGRSAKMAVRRPRRRTVSAPATTSASVWPKALSATNENVITP